MSNQKHRKLFLIPAQRKLHSTRTRAYTPVSRCLAHRLLLLRRAPRPRTSSITAHATAAPPHPQQPQHQAGQQESFVITVEPQQHGPARRTASVIIPARAAAVDARARARVQAHPCAAAERERPLGEKTRTSLTAVSSPLPCAACTWDQRRSTKQSPQSPPARPHPPNTHTATQPRNHEHTLKVASDRSLESLDSYDRRERIDSSCADARHTQATPHEPPNAHKTPHTYSRTSRRTRYLADALNPLHGNGARAPGPGSPSRIPRESTCGQE